jgi:hypothetical protein
MVLEGGPPQPRHPRDAIRVGNADEDNDSGPATGPKSLSSVELGSFPGESLIIEVYFDI